MWSFIITLLKYGPSLFTLVNEIIRLIKSMRAKDPESALKAKSELNYNVSVYKATGNMQPLRSLRDDLNKKCFGPSCSIEKEPNDNG